MEKFFGRQDELAFLEREYRASKSAFVPIYGRRRVGKSALILRFMEGKPGAYYVAKRLPAPMLQQELLQVLADAAGDPLLAQLRSMSWREALRTAVDRLPAGKKVVLALDEFQWLAEAAPELTSVLQELWDREWQHSGKMMLILCGSYIGFMEREVLGKRSPLFGRRSGQILLRPFGFKEAAMFTPAYSTVDRARTYFLCGGIPLYLLAFVQDRSVESNVVERVLGEHSPLFREADFLLREEFRDPSSYYAILTLLGQEGALSARVLGEKSELGASVQYHLHQLVQMGYVSKRLPLSGKKPPKQAVRYVLEDPLLRFWFRFVYSNTSFLSRSSPAAVFRDRIRPELEGYFGLCFERLCREALPYLYVREGITGGFEVGEYWNDGVQIDVVGLRDDNWIDLGECKWGVVRSRGKVASELAGKVERFPNPKNATIGRRIFTRSRVRAGAPSGVQWHDLEDLYAAAG